jgi:type II secretory pathway component GspD/PulD (secretin)
MSISSTKLSVIVMFLCFSIGAAVTAPSIGSAGDESEHRNKVTARFDKAALIVVASWIEKLTGRPVTAGPGVNETKQVTLIIEEPVTVDEAYARFVAMLHQNGYRTVESKDVVTIVKDDAQDQRRKP